MEFKYHSYDLETLAILDAVKHFCHYLYGVHFVVYILQLGTYDLHPRWESYKITIFPSSIDRNIKWLMRTILVENLLREYM